MVPGDLHSRHEEELRKIRKKKKIPRAFPSCSSDDWRGPGQALVQLR